MTGASFRSIIAPKWTPVSTDGRGTLGLLGDCDSVPKIVRSGV